MQGVNACGFTCISVVQVLGASVCLVLNSVTWPRSIGKPTFVCNAHALDQQ